MKSTNIQSLFILFVITCFLGINQTIAQDSISPEVASIVKMQLDEGQNKLKSLGYEICGSSFFGGKQDWFNESKQNCITIKFDDDKITEVLLNPDIAECQEGLEASRKVWEKYHDGQAPANSDKIVEERKKLADKGFKVSYWINEVSPGRNSEYWVNETTQKTMYIVWEIQGNVWVMTESTDYEMGQNPAPNK